MRRKLKDWLAPWVLCWALLLAPPSGAQETVTLNFVDADIESVVKTVSQVTGRNFLIDPRVKGTVTIVSGGPVARDLVYSILLSALRLQGFTAVEGGGITRIVPEAQAKHYFGSTTDKGIPSGDRIVTQVYSLRFANATQLVQVLRPLINPNNVIVAYPGTNTLVVTDYAENIRRISKILESIDRPVEGQIEVIPVRHASALDLLSLLTRVMPEIGQPIAPGGSPRVTVAVDTRMNALIVRSEQTSYAERIRALVADMDKPAPGGGDIRVVYLRNAEATKVAETLRALLAGDGSRATGAPAGPAPSSPGLAALSPPAGQPGLAGAATAPAPGGLGSAMGGGGFPGSSAPSGPVSSTIQAYPATNSLVITAPEHVYNSLRAVIEKLDARRAQVYVEALIVEVTTRKAAEFGIQWQDVSGINRSGGTQVIGGTNFSTTPGSNIVGAAQNFTALPPGLNIGLIRGKITLPGIGEVLDLRVLARALETDANANVLSTPNLLTLDNEEARIIVGQNVPFITGSYTTPASAGAVGVNPFQTVERRDVGLTLRVRPTVAEAGSVKLQISQEVSSVSDQSNPAGVITNKRAIDSTVLVDDGQIVVLGGLIQDDVQYARDKVPVLGDIPVLGGLFRYDSRSRVKTNLMVFLRPIVLRDAPAAQSLTGDRYDYIRNVQSGAQPPESVVLPPIPGPVMPPLSAPGPTQIPDKPLPPAQQPGR